MNDHLEQQLINELRAVLQPINETYKDFFHIQLITLCDMKEMTCDECLKSETGQQCKRCVIGVKEVEKDIYKNIRNSPEEMVYLKELERLHNKLIEETEKK